MDEFELRKNLGNKLYEAGFPLYKKGAVRRVSDPAEGISLFEVDGSTVLVRTYGSDRPILYDCDCSRGKCRHIAAVVISVNYDETTKPRDDPEDIEGILQLIRSLHEDVTSDPGYDEEENYYEDWEIEKYHLERNNPEVEYQYTFDICKEIETCIREPDNVARLFTELFTSLSTFEYDNDGFDAALNNFGELIKTSFTYASKEVLAQALAQGTYHGNCFLRDLPADVIENAYGVLRTLPVKGHYAMELLFEHGDYDEYLKADSYVDKLTKVLGKLISDGRLDEGRRIFSEYYRPDGRGSSYERSLLIPYLEQLGLDEINSEYSYGLYLEKPCEEYFSRIICGDGTHSEEELLDYARGKCRSASAPDYGILEFLLEHDRNFVLGEISRTGFVSVYTRYGYRDLTPAKNLYRRLVTHGLYDAAAVIGRGIISTRISDKDSKNYEDAAGILREMDGNKGFESVSPPHSRYLADLQANHSRLRKFWSLYNNGR